MSFLSSILACLRADDNICKQVPKNNDKSHVTLCIIHVRVM